MNWKQKLTSRKFIAALSGVIIGVGLIIGGNITEGTTTAISSIVTYLVAEGYIDAKAVKSASQTAQEVAGQLKNTVTDGE